MGKRVAWVALGVVALLVVGMFVLKIAAALVKFLFSALLMLALVGGAVYLLSRARNAVTGRRSRQIR
jgi:hypothetical protein